MNDDLLPGNDFLLNYLFIQNHHKYIALTLKKRMLILDYTNNTSISAHKSHLQMINVLDSSHWIYKSLEENFSEDHIKLWSRNPRFWRLKLLDLNVIVRVK
jgi:hypothetical protein